MFIAVDLKVVEGLAAAVARSSGVSEEAIGWGLVRLWHRCWADEIDHLDRSELAGIFGLQNLDLVTSALEAFGFLETQKVASGWRVRGAARYLRLKESRRRGAVATNAQKARSKAAGSDAQSRSRASLSDAQSRSLTESPNTEHREEKKHVTEVKPPSPPERIFEHWKKATGKTKAKADPKRLRLIQARLDEGYTEDDLRASIDWYAKSPFHCGENDRHKKYLGLDLMLRDAAHVDAGLDGIPAPSTVVKTTPDPLPEAYR